MSNLFKDIVSENIKMPADGCGVAKVLNKMDQQDRDDLDRALEDDTISSSAIDRALRKNGYRVSGNMIRRHRRKDCACGKTQ